jgi:hypothetical protein
MIQLSALERLGVDLRDRLFAGNCGLLDDRSIQAYPVQLLDEITLD